MGVFFYYHHYHTNKNKIGNKLVIVSNWFYTHFKNSYLFLKETNLLQYRFVLQIYTFIGVSAYLEV